MFSQIREKDIFIGTLILGFALRLVLAAYGHTYDVDSWNLVSDLVLAGQNVYAGTERYNYGPFWFLFLGGIKQITLWLPWSHPEYFHLLLTAVLSAVDAWIAFYLYRIFDAKSAAVYFLSPVALLVSGFSCQFYNIGIVLAFIAWQRIQKEQDWKDWRRILGAAVLFGISLSIKHVLIFFPVWILMLRHHGRFLQRLAFGAVSVAVFFLTFVPWLFDPASRQGILQHVFLYSPIPFGALLPELANLFIPKALIDILFGGIPVFSGVKIFWIVGILASGYWFTRYSPKNSFYFYLGSLVAFSCVMVDEYLFIPLVLCAVYRGSKLLWVYHAMAVVQFLTSRQFIGAQMPELQPLNTFLADVLQVRYMHAQVWLFLFLAYEAYQMRPKFKFTSSANIRRWAD